MSEIKLINKAIKLSSAVVLAFGVVSQSAATDNTYFDEMNKSYPGFAGYYYNAEGQLVLKMKPSQQKGAPASAEVMEKQIKNMSQNDVHLQASPSVIIETAKYSFSELNDLYKEYAKDIWNVEGVTFTDIDERQNKLVIGTDSENAEAEVKAQLDELFIQYDDLISFERSEVATMATLRDAQTRKRAGLQIGYNGSNGGGFVCTLGMTVRINGVKGMLTASHCDATGTIGINETTGTNYGQPNPSSGLIATESIDPSGSPRRSDALFAPYSAGVRAPIGRIAKTVGGPNSGSLDRDGTYLTVTGKADAVVGQAIQKIGRTTGWTSGTVTRTCVDLNFGSTVGTTSCQTASNAGSDSGDSGSGVFIRNGENATFVGILSGGINSTGEMVFSPVSNIEADLGNIGL